MKKSQEVFNKQYKLDTEVFDTIEEGGRDYVDISEDIVVEGTDVAADMGEQVTDIAGETVTAIINGR